MSGCHGKFFTAKKGNKHEKSNSNGLMSSMRFMNIKCFENAFFMLEMSTFVPYHLSLVVFVRLSLRCRRKKVPMSNRRNRKTVQPGPFFSEFFFIFLFWTGFCLLPTFFCTLGRFSLSISSVFWSIFINHIYVSWKLHWIRKSNALYKERGGLKRKVFCFHLNLWLFIVDLMHSSYIRWKTATITQQW